MLFFIVFLNIIGLSQQNITRSVFQNDDTSTFHKKQNTFERLLMCTTSMDGSYVVVYCKGLNDIDKLLWFLQTKYRHSKIDHIYITKSVIEHLPSEAFKDLYIQKIFIKKSLVKYVSPDAFLGINGFIEIRLDNFNLVEIPSSIGKLHTLRAMWMERGKLKDIKLTLQNCTNMQLLSLKANQIETIDHRLFLGMTNLKHLDLSNNTIKWLDSKIFSSLNQLTHLNLMGNRLQNVTGLLDNHQYTLEVLLLSGNNISDIETLTRNNVYSLKFLSLDGNPLKIIRNDTFKKFPRLEQLYMNWDSLRIIEPSAFPSLIHLCYLYIKGNSLFHLNNNTFINMNALQKVDMSDNHLESIDGLFQHTLYIQAILVSSNRLRTVNQQCFENTTRLNYLYLSHNLLYHIQKDTFVNNEILVQLQLNNNVIKTLEPDSFRGLFNLKYLFLSSNLLTTLNGSINSLRNLQVLDLKYNYLTVLDATSFLNMPSLRNIDVSENSLKSVHGAFVNLINLLSLNLQNNSVEVITENSFSFPKILKDLKLEGNPLTCNCLLKWLVELIANEKVSVDNVTCVKPEWLNRELLKQLSLKDVIEWPEDCPHDCTCICFPNSTDYYIGVYCAGLQLRTTPNILPIKTGHLDLSRNQIESVSQVMLNNLIQLQNLLLHENNLTSIPDLSAVELRTLTLANNHLTRFSVPKIDSTFLKNATLSNNRWLCDCQTRVFRKWLLAEEMVVSDINTTKCDDVKTNENLRNRPIISLTEDLLCPSFIVIYASIAVAVLGFFLLVASAKVAYNRYRMNIKIWMYSKGICSCLSCIKEEDLDEDKRFDAFLSYSSKDEKFITQQLVPMLENGEKPYHLCLHYRHFVPGSFIQESIMQAVQLSKRTILVLSKNFLQSEWCRLEFRSAHHQVLEEKLNRLIIIILGELPPKDDIDPEINLYLESTTYLRWGENNFWNKLNYVMPRTICTVTEEDKMKLLD